MRSIRLPSILTILTTGVALLLAAGSAGASPFAVEVVSYTPGTGVTSGFDDSSNALGLPSRNNGTSVFMGEEFDNGDVTPFNGPFRTDQIVSVGDGGELVVRFDHAVVDDPQNPFGLDLIVFGNAFFFDPIDGGPIALDIFEDPAQISVSQFGSSWSPITSVNSDSLFPTRGFLDTTGPFSSDGDQPANFRLPVDPAILWQGEDYPGILGLYGDSGGGTGVDIAETGLGWIQYVRITSLGGVTTEIDAFSDVKALPEPAELALLGGGLALLCALLRLESGPSSCGARGAGGRAPPA